MGYAFSDCIFSATDIFLLSLTSQAVDGIVDRPAPLAVVPAEELTKGAAQMTIFRPSMHLEASQGSPSLA